MADDQNPQLPYEVVWLPSTPPNGSRDSLPAGNCSRTWRRLPHPVNIEDEMRRSYLDYSMSVIIGRTADVRRPRHPPPHHLRPARNGPRSTEVPEIGQGRGHVAVATIPTATPPSTTTMNAWPANCSAAMQIDGQGASSVDGDPHRHAVRVRLTRIAGEDALRPRLQAQRLHPNWKASPPGPTSSTRLACRFQRIRRHRRGRWRPSAPQPAGVVNACISIISSPAGHHLRPRLCLQHVQGPDFPGRLPLRQEQHPQTPPLARRSRAPRVPSKTSRGDARPSSPRSPLGQQASSSASPNSSQGIITGIADDSA